MGKTPFCLTIVGKRLCRLVFGEREEAMRMASGGEVFLWKLCS